MKMDLTNMISNGTEETQVPEQKLTKEEYAAKKQQEREEVWAEVDSQAQGVFQGMNFSCSKRHAKDAEGKYPVRLDLRKRED